MNLAFTCTLVHIGSAILQYYELAPMITLVEIKKPKLGTKGLVL